MIFLAMKTPLSCSPHSAVLAHLTMHPWGHLALLAALIRLENQREDVRRTKLAPQLLWKAESQ